MDKLQIRKIRRNAVLAMAIAAGVSYFVILRRMNSLQEEIRNLTVTVDEQIDISQVFLEYGIRPGDN